VLSFIAGGKPPFSRVRPDDVHLYMIELPAGIESDSLLLNDLFWCVKKKLHLVKSMYWTGWMPYCAFEAWRQVIWSHECCPIAKAVVLLHTGPIASRAGGAVLTEKPCNVMPRVSGAIVLTR